MTTEIFILTLFSIFQVIALGFALNDMRQVRQFYIFFRNYLKTYLQKQSQVWLEVRDFFQGMRIAASDYSHSLLKATPEEVRVGFVRMEVDFSSDVA